ncbi:TolB family protein [Actinoplanes teichomyceticus]|uniref:WD40 repeat protein n=1 Tax=Actinoplanes teichomyceticus TaxID=1867 RepID=A0A561VM86_ACTTI|nr:PD40 domain-containing protein [Actinoplanes teichomyceticus]TWG12702.1 WD40 repeat protein [Actinoplanes teichomyceticus]GIF13435.1 hypothetical protein Ate01nite_34670 [Actinoplanes teichomyceticus]
MRVRRTTGLLAVAVTAAVTAGAGPAAALPDRPELISVSRTGGPGGGPSDRPAISADGRYVAFESEANDLVPDDFNVAADVFLRDRRTGTTSRVSRSAAGGEANGASGQPSLSADGRYVAFDSVASDVVAGDTNESSDVFVLDRSTGRTSRISRSGAGAQADARSVQPAISRSGRYVAFLSDATNLVPGDTNATTDVFVHDRLTEVTTRESVAGAGQADSFSVDVAISADGHYVGFSSYASNLVPGDSNGALDVFVRDRLARVTTRVDVSGSGAQTAPQTESHGVAISADGRYAVYESTASDLVPGDTNGRSDVFRRDLRAGVTTRVSVSGAGDQADGSSFAASISADGRYVAFDSDATNLTPGDPATDRDVFVRDMRAGRTTAVTAPGEGFDDRPAISADGRQVAFTSRGPGGAADVFAAAR